MNKLVTDLALIGVASKDESRFDQFKSAVKKVSVGDFDKLAAPVVSEITSSIDCTKCGNCCKVQEPGVTEEEMILLANLKQMNPGDFKNQYVSYDHQQVSFLCQQPCVFLNGTTCSIYSHRPASCADFPGLHRPGLKWRMTQMRENYGICPIVYNVVETLIHQFSKQE